MLGARLVDQPDRVLSTVLFTDIVSSTERAAAAGDSRWREFLDTHDRLARENVAYFRGRIIQMLGDGLLATFDGPARAVTCAARLQRALQEFGLESRAAVHTGEVELRGEGVGGLAVHVAARILALAGPAEVLTSATVKDLTAGAGIVFTDRGQHMLKGLPEPWQLFVASV